jgi:hypothetical protein
MFESDMALAEPTGAQLIIDAAATKSRSVTAPSWISDVIQYLRERIVLGAGAVVICWFGTPQIRLPRPNAFRFGMAVRRGAEDRFIRPAGNGYWLPVLVVRRLEANPALCLSFRGVNWTLLIDSLDLSSR